MVTYGCKIFLGTGATILENIRQFWVDREGWPPLRTLIYNPEYKVTTKSISCSGGPGIYFNRNCVMLYFPCRGAAGKLNACCQITSQIAADCWGQYLTKRDCPIKKSYTDTTNNLQPLVIIMESPRFVDVIHLFYFISNTQITDTTQRNIYLIAEHSGFKKYTTHKYKSII